MKYNKQKFIAMSDMEKLELIKKELNQETHLGTTKRDLLLLLDWLYFKTHIVDGLNIEMPHEPCIDCPRASWIDFYGKWTYGCDMQYCVADDEY